MAELLKLSYKKTEKKNEPANTAYHTKLVPRVPEESPSD